MLIDTSILIDILRADKDTRELEEYLDKHDKCIASPTVFELWCGALLGRVRKEEREKIKGLINSFEVLELDKECALEAARIYSELLRQGREIPPIDAMIAGIAVKRGEKIITKDKHFSWIKDLNVEIWDR